MFNIYLVYFDFSRTRQEEHSTGRTIDRKDKQEWLLWFVLWLAPLCLYL